MRRFAVLLTALILALFPISASAHGLNAYHGKDKAHLGSGHANVWVYDRECDGHSVRVEIRYPSWVYAQNDANGCSSGGTKVGVGSTADAFRVCEFDYYWRCSNWVRIS